MKKPKYRTLSYPRAGKKRVYVKRSSFWVKLGRKIDYNTVYQCLFVHGMKRKEIMSAMHKGSINSR